MGNKDHESKIKNLIKDDRPSRLKSYVKKHKICAQDIKLKKGRSLLHYCCRHGSGVILRYLLHEGLDASEPDHCGDLPLHICLQRALNSEVQQSKEVYAELVIPLLEISPESLDERNRENVSCRELLQKLVEKNSEQASHVDEEETQWSDRLQDEMIGEHEEMYGRYSDDYDVGIESKYETYDQWADRLYRDRELKERYGKGSYDDHPKKRKSKIAEKSTKKSGVVDEEKLKRTREELKRKYEERQKLDQENHKKRRKCVYEKNFEKLLDSKDVKLTFDDMPWPSKGSVSDVLDVLFSDFHDKQNPSYRTYLKKQQVKWHPDKFTQKFGKRIVDIEKDKIMSRVKEISQALNKLSDSTTT